METMSGKLVSAAKCKYWRLPKPRIPRKICHGTPKCVRYHTVLPKKQCSKRCGQAKRTYTGKVLCKETRTGRVRGHSACAYWKLRKPSAPRKKCRATAACTHYHAIAAKGHCSTSCGQARRVYHGKVVCKETLSHRVVPDARCRGKARPATPSKVCNPTRACCHTRCHTHQPKCSVTVYKHCNYRGSHKTFAPGDYGMSQLGIGNDHMSSIRISGACTAYLYQHHRFGGKVKTLFSSHSCFTSLKMVMLQKIKIVDNTKVHTQVIHDGGKLGAAHEALVQAKSSTGGWRRRRRTWNDQVSSLKVRNRAARQRVCKKVCRL